MKSVPPGDSLKELYDALEEDKWRISNPFDPILDAANRLLLHPFATDAEREEALSYWLQYKTNQPCLFGRIAAAVHQLHFCILTETDLRESDQFVAEKILREQLRWKQQAVLPGGAPKHGFVLAAVSPRLSLARPDNNLKKFSLRLRELWRLPTEKDQESNDVTFETLYLKHPTEEKYFKYTFSVDYFASAADGRWWSDHRIPGGVAFSANSLGHMVGYKELYQNKPLADQIEWALKTAMLTIAEARKVEGIGPATWLLPLENNSPHQASECPFTGTQRPALAGKDWSTYGGLLHTDHSIRDEFFLDKAPARAKNPYQMDFTYIFMKSRSDHVQFMAGQQIAAEAVFEEIGTPDKWRVIVKGRPILAERPPHKTTEVETLLGICRAWAITAEELEQLMT